MKYFGAVYIGTHAISMRIFGIKKNEDHKRIESLNIPIAIEEEIIERGHIHSDTMNKICYHINEFKNIIKSYKCDDMKVYANPAYSRISDSVFIKDFIKKNCGLDVTIMSNSEYRLMTYKRLSAHPLFKELISSDYCGIINIGGGDTQLTTAGKGGLYHTEHIGLGAVLLYDAVKNIPENTKKRRAIMIELIDKQLAVIRSRMHESDLSNLIIMGDYALETFTKSGAAKESFIDAKQYIKQIDEALKMPDDKLREYLSVTDEDEELLAPFLIAYKRVVEIMGVKKVFVPAIDILEGIAFSYALDKKLVPAPRDYGADVLSAARYMANRYSGYSPHIEALVKNSTLIFNATKSEHDMGKRELLLLQCAAILHDIGKFVALTGTAGIAYDIIMASEIIGLSHEEREIVANIVQYNSNPLIDWKDSGLSYENYLIVSRCAAIMRLSNVIDRSHKQKFKKITAKLSDDRKLIITVTAEDDLLLEKSMFNSKTDVFEKVFLIKPVLKHKKI